jgi:hypothetical protein
MPKIEKTLKGPVLLVNCGDCVHFNKFRHPQLPRVCSEDGVRDYAKPCEKFQVNWQHFNYSETFTKILKEVVTEDLPRIAALINAEIATRTAKYYYGMPVYVRLFGEDFISNYARCNVITAQGRYVYVQGMKTKYYGMFVKKSVFSEKQFIAKLKQLALNKRYTDPKLKTFTDWKPAKRGTMDIKDIPVVDDVIEYKNSMVFTVNDHGQ